MSDNKRTVVPSAAAFREAIAKVEWTREWCARENAHDQQLLQALGPNPYPANVGLSNQRQDNRLRHLREEEARYAPIRSVVIQHLVAHAGLATASERVVLMREMQRFPSDGYLADQLAELEQMLVEQPPDAPDVAPRPARARNEGAKTKADPDWQRMMRLTDDDMKLHPGRTRQMSLQDLVSRTEIDPEWMSRGERTWRYYEKWWAEVRDDPDAPAS